MAVNVWKMNNERNGFPPDKTSFVKPHNENG